jgi:phosphoglycolate phosphatase-like HAD superfamily hydrolase
MSLGRLARIDLGRLAGRATGLPHHLTNQTSSTLAAMSTPGTTSPGLRIIRGVVFDMVSRMIAGILYLLSTISLKISLAQPPTLQDGTLTVPCINFPEMRRRVGVTGTMDILKYIKSLSPEGQNEANRHIADIEQQALKDMQLMPGVLELCSLLDVAGIPRALVTRNVNTSVEFFHKTHFTLPPFFPALTREFTPYKPHPASLHTISEHWGIPASELCMIGDSARDDVGCGRSAGAVTILLDTEGNHSDVSALPEEQQPDFFAKSLHEVTEILHYKVKLVAPDEREKKK